MTNSKFNRTSVVISDVFYTDMMPDDKGWHSGMLNWFYYDECDFKLLYDQVSRNTFFGYKVLCCFDKADMDIPLGILIYIEFTPIIIVSVLEVNPKYRKRHVGKLLLDELKQRNKKIILQSVDSAKPFYEKLGFISETSTVNCSDMSWKP